MSVPAVVSIVAGSIIVIAWVLGTFYVWDSGMKEGFMSGKTRVEYYHAPWCRYCEEFNRKVWGPASEWVRQNGLPVDMVRLEADQYSAPGSPENRWKIDGGSLNNPFAEVSAYPFVKLLKPGSHSYKYEGEYDPEAFLKWVAKYA